jgi:hypothetical protein
VFDPVCDVGVELSDGAVRGAAQLADDELAEPALDEVDPGCAGRDEVQMKRGWAASQRSTAGVLWVEC